MAMQIKVPKSTPALPKDLFLLNPEVAFLNHGSFGATPKVVFEKYQQLQRELEAQPVLFLSNTRNFPEMMASVRSALSGFVGCNDADLVLYPNATMALNAVIRSLDFEPGDEVLTTNHEYGALDRTWKFVGRKNARFWNRVSGKQEHENIPKYVQLEFPLPVTSRRDFVDAFWSQVNERTRVIYLSHITSPTALILPVEEICARARERGILSIVDGAHAVGHLPLNMESIGADFYTSNCHKWLCSPKGSAFLYARPSVKHLLEPLIVSWGYEREFATADEFVQLHEWFGTFDPSALLSIPSAIEFQQAHQWEKIRRECADLARYARDTIHQLTGLPPICPDGEGWFQQMFTAELPACSPDEIKARLYDEYRVEVPVFTWSGKPYIRVSVQAYTSLEDIEQLLGALKSLLK